ncbi:hypothetical protein H0E87_004507 [Populus deltoides]|uniref:Uncharacterized protein n=1 Tax=Populus deltoides TaxID=3696 RepID=A0A8T2ZH32_POPDE|nr:hypothetical protein H0E87_004507 [Populus deltoides]KAH8516163.1 hypothetical protein H0E87_004507 [Populus deltoides]
MLCSAKSTLPHNWASLPTGSRRRSQVYGTNPSFHLATSKHNHRIQFLGHQKMNIFTTTLEVLHHGKNRKMDMAVYSTGVESGIPFPLPFNLPFDLNPGSWQTWVLGLIVALTPFGISKWWPMLKSKGRDFHYQIKTHIFFEFNIQHAWPLIIDYFIQSYDMILGLT